MSMNVTSVTRNLYKKIYDHTRLCRVMCMLSMYVYIEYMIILIVYNIEVIF
jgi:hypothetical protein